MKRLDWWWLRAQGAVCLIFGRTAQALSIFDDMARRFPAERYPLASRAHVLAQAGRHDEALADYRRLTELHPADAAGWFNLGFVLESLGRYEEARQSFERATTLDPKLDRAWYGLGLVLIRLQRLDEAVAGPQAQHRIATHEPVRLVPAGAGACGPTSARRGGEDHSPPPGVRAQGRRAAGARDRIARRAKRRLDRARWIGPGVAAGACRRTGVCAPNVGRSVRTARQ